MKAPNFLSILKAFRKRKPFRPYLIELVSGDRIRVTHPEVLRVQGEVLIYQGPDGRHRLFEIEAICQLLDVPPG